MAAAKQGLTLIFLGLAACEGSISASERPVSDPVSECATVSERSVLPRRVRRVRGADYRAIVGRLMGATAAVDFPVDPSPNGYDTRAETLRVSGPLVDLLWKEVPALASKAARQLLTNRSCAANNTTCARQLLSGFAARAYRRPASSEELDDLLEVFATGPDFEGSLALAIEVVLQSSSMLFHTELGEGQLTPYETAALLSFLVTGGPPDEQLAALAAAGPLSSELREREARRLFASADARLMIGDFATQWLEVSRVGSLEKNMFPEWAGLRADAVQETRDFVAAAVTRKEPLRTLFTADWTLASPALVAHYGTAPKAGVLTHTSVMAALSIGAESAPIQRGRLVRTRLLCQFKRFAPPADLQITLPPLDANATTRERFAAHSSNASCQSCHRVLDPIGFGFENFDAIGSFRTTENGRPVDASGELIATDVDGTFDGVPQLGAMLGQSAAAGDCFTQNWFEYALGQPMDEFGLPGLCALRDAAGAPSPDASMEDGFIQLIRSELFVARSP